MSNASDRAVKWIRWIARIWGGVVVMSVLLVVIGYAWDWVTAGEADPYAVEDYPLIEELAPLFGLLSAVGLAIAWRWEGLGGTIAFVSSLAMLSVLLIHWPITEDFPRYLVAPYGVWLIITIPGILFLVTWWRSRERTVPQRGA